jgi:hypothetical protein
VTGVSVAVDQNVIFTPLGDTAFYCQGDSILLYSQNSSNILGGLTYQVNFGSLNWTQITCAPYNSTPLTLGTQYSTASNTQWNANVKLTTPGLFMFAVTGDCIATDEFGDTISIGLSVDTVLIMVYPTPTANAGTDTLSCAANSPGFPWLAQLNASDPSPFSGMWSIDGLPDSLFTFNDPTNHNTLVSFAGSYGSQSTNMVTYNWIVTGTEGCLAMDQVIVYHPQEVHPVTILQDSIEICNNQIQMGPGISGVGATSTFGAFTVGFPILVNSLGDTVYYQWTEIGPMNDTLVTLNYNDQNTEIIVDSAGYYTFVLAVYGYCGTSSDTVVIHFLSDTAISGPARITIQNCANSDTLLVIHTVPGILDSVGYVLQYPTGTGATINPVTNSSFYLEGIDTTEAYYQIYYTFYINGTCPRTELITVWNRWTPTLFVSDTVIPCGLTYCNFGPQIAGTPVWPGQSGGSNMQTFTLINQPTGASAFFYGQTTLVNMNVPGDYFIKITRWSFCQDTIRDTLKITVLGPAPPASAGSAIVLPCGANQVNLYGNVPVWGVGAWRVEAPNGLPPSHPDYGPDQNIYNGWAYDNFTDTTIANPSVSGLDFPGTYNFTWFIQGDSTCGNHWDFISVYVPDPENDTAFAGNDTVICDTTDFWLNAASHNVLNGQWTQDSTNFNLISFSHPDSISTQVFGMMAGHSYQFYYTLVGACNHATDSIIIIFDPEDCCFAQNSPEYTQWLTDVILNVGTVMSGKYFIDGMVTVNSWIDMTNVDLVFGECAGMYFGDSAQVRANNSVFRPCAFDKTWLGFEWAGSKNSIIESCTFKNAFKGLHVHENGSIQIKNNFFNNNANAIYLENTRQTEGITGNKIIWDTWLDSLYYNGCPGLVTNPSTMAGIVGGEATVVTVISDNEFIATNFETYNTPGGNLRFQGVYFAGGSAHFSNNRFSNNFVALVAGSAGIYFTNNTVEVNSLNVSHYMDVALENCYVGIIEGNRFVNHVTNQDNEGSYPDAIFLKGNEGPVSVERNHIEGYRNGVFGYQNNGDIFISENNIINYVSHGIYLDKAIAQISCNTLNGKFQDRFTPIGIRMITNDPYVDFIQRSAIRSNCIYENVTAILLEGIDNYADSTNYLVTNNFLYNYSTYGLEVVDYSLESGPGNSYVSNNYGNAFSADIAANNCTVNSNLDYGVLNGTTAGTGVINFSNQNILHSTASCSNQISDYAGNAQNSAQMTNTYTACLPIKLDSANVWEGYEWGSFGLKQAAFSNLTKLETQEVDKKANQLFGLSSMNRNRNEGENSFTILANLNNLSSYGKTQLNLAYALWDRDLVLAKATLINFNPGNAHENDWKVIRSREIDHLLEPKTFAEIELWDKTGLNTTEGEELQKRYIHLFNGTRPFKGQPIQPYYPTSGQKIALAKEGEVKVFPNPAKDELNLQYSFEGEGIIALLISDLTGRVVQEQNLAVSSSVSSLNIKDLPEGMYLLELFDQKGNSKKTKFIKQ